MCIVDTEDSVHSIVLHGGTNPGNPTHKSNIALGFVQGKLLLLWEEFRAVLRDDVSTAEVIRSPGLDRLHYRDREKIATNDPIPLRIMTTTHTWGDDHGRASSSRGSRRFCQYIHL